MISVIIPTINAERLLPRCFDSLIPAAVRGVVREVIVADGGSSDATLMIADAAGAHIVHAGPTAARSWPMAHASRESDWLLFLHPETALEPGWDVEAESFLAQAMMERPRAAVFRFALEDFGGEARRAEAMANLRAALLALPYGDQGLADPQAALSEAGRLSRPGRHGRCRPGAPHRPAPADLFARPRRQCRAPETKRAARRRAHLLHKLRVPSRLLANL